VGPGTPTFYAGNGCSVCQTVPSSRTAPRSASGRVASGKVASSSQGAKSGTVAALRYSPGRGATEVVYGDVHERLHNKPEKPFAE
jgi:hypothetical protein